MSWELTANHYLALPAIGLADGALYGASVLHRGLAGQLCWAGSPLGVPGASEGLHPGTANDWPLLAVRVSIDGVPRTLRNGRWERLDRWIPRLTADAGDGARVIITWCTPGGYDPVVRGGLLVVQVEHGGASNIEIALEGHWAWTLRTVATTRPLSAPNRLWRGTREDGVALEAGEPPLGAAFGIMAGGSAVVETSAGDGAWAAMGRGVERTAPQGTPLRFRLMTAPKASGPRTTQAFYFGVAPDRDGALATAARLASIGWDDLLHKARLDLASLNRASDEAQSRELVARNLAFHHYFGAARAIDDDRIYPLSSRSPFFGPAGVYDERRALAWSLPGFLLTDPMLARELLIRCLETWSDRAGLLHRYLDGGVLDGSFSLGRLCDYGAAIERYIDVARDSRFIEEPIVRQVLHELDEICWDRLHPEIFLASTEVLPGGERADHPYCAFDNVMLWKLCRVLTRFWQSGAAPIAAHPPRLRNGADEVEAAFWQRFTTQVKGLPVLACTTDLQGHAAVYDDPAGSLTMLPWFGFCTEDDPIWSNTMELLYSPDYPLWLGSAKYPGMAGRSRPREASFAALCTDLLGPRCAPALEILRSLELPAGVACETWDPATGRVATGPFAADLAGFLVWALLERREPRSQRREKMR